MRWRSTAVPIEHRHEQGCVAATGKLVVFLRRIEEFRTPAFIARRMHLSQAELFAQLAAYEGAIGAPLVEVSETLQLTAAARSLLDRR